MSTSRLTMRQWLQYAKRKKLETHKRIRVANAEPTCKKEEGGASYRCSHTQMTHGFCTGDKGITELQFGRGQVSSEDIAFAHETYGSEIHVVVVDQKSHMYNGRHFLRWMETTAKWSYLRQRKKYSIGMEIWGLCVIDAGPGHVCWREGEQILRTEIENQIRVKFVVLGGKQSSCLNAMDQLHQLLRANHKIWCKLHFKDYDCVYLRPAPGSEDRAANGAIIR